MSRRHPAKRAFALPAPQLARRAPRLTRPAVQTVYTVCSLLHPSESTQAFTSSVLARFQSLLRSPLEIDHSTRYNYTPDHYSSLKTYPGTPAPRCTLKASARRRFTLRGSPTKAHPGTLKTESECFVPRASRTKRCAPRQGPNPRGARHLTKAPNAQPPTRETFVIKNHIFKNDRQTDKTQTAESPPCSKKIKTPRLLHRVPLAA